jgi:hypothetical protein
MNKWFESKSFASYAKTALMQAQKTIDQVLDIKEEETVAQSVSSTTQTSSGAYLKSKSANELNDASKHSSSTKQAVLNKENEAFFSTFLESTNKRPSTRSSSPNATNSNPSLEDIKFEDFLNKTDPEESKEKKQKMKKSSKIGQTHPNKSSAEQLNENLSNSPNFEIEHIEKKNWIQNYVDSDGNAANLIQTVSSVLSSSTIEIVGDSKIASERESVQSTTSKFYVESSNKLDMTAEESKNALDLTNSTITNTTSTTNWEVNTKNTERAENIASLNDSEYVILFNALNKTI